MKKLVVSAVVALLYSINVSYADTEHNVKICKIQMTVSGTAYIYPCTFWYSKAGNKNGWISWDAKTVGGQQMYETATLAKVLNSTVTVRIDTTDNSWYYDKTIIVRQQ